MKKVSSHAEIRKQPFLTFGFSLRVCRVVLNSFCSETFCLFHYVLFSSSGNELLSLKCTHYLQCTREHVRERKILEDTKTKFEQVQTVSRVRFYKQCFLADNNLRSCYMSFFEVVRFALLSITYAGSHNSNLYCCAKNIINHCTAYDKPLRITNRCSLEILPSTALFQTVCWHCA